MGGTKCILFGSDSPANVFVKLSSWSDNNRQWLNTVHKQPIPQDALVCRACDKFIKRNAGRENVVPWWLPKVKCKPPTHCMVVGCEVVAHTSTSIVTYEVAQEYLDLIEYESVLATPRSQSVTLCNSHYQHLYREVHFPQLCASCYTQPKYGGEYTRRCPDPQVISEFLKQNFDFDNMLTAESKIYKPCYLFH